jgi:hypothetical protein
VALEGRPVRRCTSTIERRAVVDRDLPERRRPGGGDTGGVGDVAFAGAAKRRRSVKTVDSIKDVNTGTASLRTAVLVANSPIDASHVIIEHCSGRGW